MNFQPDFQKEHNETPELRAIPIPEAGEEVREKFEKKEWRDIPITESVTRDPKPLEVIPNRFNPGKAMAWPAYYKTVMEENENDGKARGFGELAQAIEGKIQTSPLVKVRAEIKTKLDEAQEILDQNPDTSNFQLVAVDGYRRIDVQRELFNTYYGYVSKEHRGLPEEELMVMARKMVSEAPKDPEILRKSPPPHSTGGAVDIILVYKDKINTASDYWLQEAMIPFGAKFDEMMDPTYRDKRSETIFYEKELTEKGTLSREEQEALEHRRILYNLLTGVGFSNYFTEFWHYDFGNQFNAAATGKSSAEFGFAGGIEDNRINEDLTAEESSFEAYKVSHGSEEAERVKHHFGL